MEQDISSVVRNLPSLPADIPIIVYKRRSCGDIHHYIDFKVRRGVVWQWLVFLKNESPAYSDIEISDIHLSQLPEDGFITNSLRHVVLEDDTNPMRGEGNQQNNGPDTSGSTGGSNGPIREEFMMRDPQSPDANENDSIINHLNGTTPEYPWPEWSNFLNDFETPSLQCRAFPWLFPFGKGMYTNALV